MTCETMLVRLLDADRDELEGRGTSVVAVHVRDCARCGAVAARLLDDTRVLAAHVAARPRAPRAVARPLLWSGALAVAGLALFMSRPERVAPGAPADQHRVAVRVVAPVARPATAMVTPPSRAEIAVAATRLAGGEAATPERLMASQSSDEPVHSASSSGVSVNPPAGVRSVVLATRNEKITVVWLY